jgi:hypothetical protein
MPHTPAQTVPFDPLIGRLITTADKNLLAQSTADKRIVQNYYRALMKIKNITQFAALIGLLVTGSAHSMQVAFVNGLKTSIRHVGTLLGVGNAVAPAIIRSSKKITGGDIMPPQC